MARPARRSAAELGHHLLAGVGDPDAVRVDPGERVVHVRRPLTADEEEQLGRLHPGWHAFRPVDGAGTGGFLEQLAKRARR